MTTAPPVTALVPTPGPEPATIALPASGGGDLSLRRRGHGAPGRLLAHAWGGHGGQLLPLVAGLPGATWDLDFAGHGASAPRTRPWDYEEHTEDLRSALNATGARQIVGQSLGAGAALRVAAEEPQRFSELVLVLPPDVISGHSAAALNMLAEVIAGRESADTARVERALLAASPAPSLAVPGAARYVRWYARAIVASRAPSENLLQAALARPEQLRSVRARVLVVAQEGDVLHPLDATRAIAELVPGASLVVFPVGEPCWRNPDRLREHVIRFLDAGPSV